LNKYAVNNKIKTKGKKMSNIQNAFKNGKAFIGFVTGGDPTVETTTVTDTAPRPLFCS